MYPTTKTAIAGCALLATMAITPSASAKPKSAEKEAQRVLEAHRADAEFVGAVMAVDHLQGGALVTAGYQVVGGRDPVDAEVPWIIGSTTKTFVAVAVLQLVQEGALDLEASIQGWFPHFPRADRITVRDLLQHTSGIGDYLLDARVLGDPKRAWSPQELIEVAASLAPLGEPGGAHHYSNSNYTLLGEIIAKVTSRPWYVEVRYRILEPLGLKRTGYPAEANALPTGRGHILKDGDLVEATDRWHISLGGAAGAMYSTASDLLVFVKALRDGKLIDAGLHAQMRTFISAPDIGHVVHAYGLGLESYTINNLVLIGHMGTASAHQSFMGYDPETQASNGDRLGDLRGTTQQADISVPLVYNEGNTQLVLSAAYQRLAFDYRGFEGDVTEAHAISVSAFLTQRLTESWSLLLVAAPAYSEDFVGTASFDALTMTVVAGASYEFTDNFASGLGVGLQNVFGEPLPLPVLQLDWTITQRLQLEALLPQNISLTWLPLDQVGIRASVVVNGNTYHADADRFGVGNPQLNYSAAQAELGARLFILPWLHVTARGGYTIFRRFEFSDGRESIPDGTFDLANGGVFGVDLGIGG